MPAATPPTDYDDAQLYSDLQDLKAPGPELKASAVLHGQSVEAIFVLGHHKLSVLLTD